MSARAGSGVDVRTVKAFFDDRGVSFSIESETLAGFTDSHAVLNRPGCVRGNHSHPNGEEILYVQGPALVRWSRRAETGEQLVGPGELVRFQFPAGVAHAVRNEGREACLLVSLQRSTDGDAVRTVSDPILD